ncbi:MAG: hypothetical protein HN380_29645 [Victivallales bacterium]|nr:hypothetical protein [Victivallales bacterium]
MDGVDAPEERGEIKRATEGGEYEAGNGSTPERGSRGTREGAAAGLPQKPEEDAPDPDDGSSTRITAEDIHSDAKDPDANVDLDLKGAGGPGARRALSDSAVEKAIRAHAEAMRRLTGAEKAATREYYRRLKDIQ